MNENTMFRLKVSYVSTNQDTQAVEKQKKEILAQCANYTDAECLMQRIISNENMDEFGKCDYELVKTKVVAQDVYADSVMKNDNHAVCGLISNFFDEDGHGLYAVDALHFGDKEMKEKDEKKTYYIAATDVADAMCKARKILRHSGFQLQDCVIKSAKLDNAIDVYLSSDAYEKIMSESAEIFS